MAVVEFGTDGARLAFFHYVGSIHMWGCVSTYPFHITPSQSKMKTSVRSSKAPVSARVINVGMIAFVSVNGTLTPASMVWGAS